LVEGITTIKRFEDLECWQAARELTKDQIGKEQIKRIQPIKQMKQHTSYDLNLIFGDYKCGF